MNFRFIAIILLIQLSNPSLADQNSYLGSGSLGEGSATLLSDCRTVITSATVSQNKGNGWLDPSAEQFKPWRQKLVYAVDSILDSGEDDYGVPYFISFDNWNVLTLKQPSAHCDTAEPAKISKEELMRLGGLLYVFTPNSSGLQARACELLKDEDITGRPDQRERESLLFYDCKDTPLTSGQGVFARIHGAFYLVGVHLGDSFFNCPTGATEETEAKVCPQEARWISNDFADAIQSAFGPERPLVQFGMEDKEESH